MTNPGELSPLDLEIAAMLAKKKSDYQFIPQMDGPDLSEKTVVAMVGPTGAGKSFLTDRIIEKAPEFTPIGTRTTRARRDNDPKNYTTANEDITHQWMADAVERHALLNYSVFDTGHVYATAPEDVGTYAIGPILSDSVESLMTAGFKDFYPVFVIARGALYQQRLEEERLHFPDIQRRLTEALNSLLFAELNVEAPWLTCVDTGNTLDQLDQAANDVIRTVYHRTHPIMTTGHKLLLLTEMKNAVQNTLSQLR